MRLELLAEYRKCRSLNDHEIERFITAGVPPMALGGCSYDGEFVIAAAAVVPCGKKRFEMARYRAGEAVQTFIFLARDEGGRLTDLVAWTPDSEPEWIASWLGRATLLGEHRVSAPRLTGPLLVHDSPMDWLRAERDGVVVVDDQRAAPMLRTAAPLATESVASGLRLRNRLTLEAPRILVKAA